MMAIFVFFLGALSLAPAGRPFFFGSAVVGSAGAGIASAIMGSAGLVFWTCGSLVSTTTSSILQ